METLSGMTAEAVALDGEPFDQMVLTCVLEKVLGEYDRHGGSVARRLGLGGTALGVLLMLFVPGHPILTPANYAGGDEGEEQAWVRDLLLRHADRDNAYSAWLSSIVARRAMESNHLWEDLGLPHRAALSHLMRRHFPGLAALNENADMRWKRFFYRQLCEDEGLSHCTSPTCGTCPDVAECFTPDSAEAQMARAKQAPA
jgi:nitrogen fixation protein NifQ